MKVFLKISQVWGLAVVILGLSLYLLESVPNNLIFLSSSPALAFDNPNYRVLDSFNSGSSRECFANNGGEIDAPCPIQEQSYVRMAYNVDVLEANAHAFLPIYLEMDLSAWDFVWIVIKGDVGGEEVLAEFTDCDETVFPKVRISEFLYKKITTDWQAVAIPLSTFAEIQDWSCIGRFSIVANKDISSRQGIVYIDEVALLASTVTIDDFSDQLFNNELSGSSGPWQSSFITSPVQITTTFPDGALKLSYSISNVRVGGGGYWSKLRSTNLLSLKDYLLFNVHGETGQEELSVQLIDCDDKYYVEIKVSDYLNEGITTSWRPVTIPLVAFVDILASTKPTEDATVNWQCIKQIAFNIVGRPLYENSQGHVFIDDIKLAPKEAFPQLPPIWIDRFQDCDHWNALSWRWYYTHTSTTESGFTALPTSTDRIGDYGCGYQFKFDVSVGESGWAWSELKGIDVTDYEALEFFLKGKSGGEYTNVYLRDRIGTEFNVGVIATNNWQRIRLPLSTFEEHGVVMTDLLELRFAYENGFWQGEVYIDDISFRPPVKVFLPIIMQNYSSPLPPDLSTSLYINQVSAGGIDPIEIRDPNQNDLLLSCKLAATDTVKFCGKFPPVITYTIIANTANCGQVTRTFADAFPASTITRTVICRSP